MPWKVSTASTGFHDGVLAFLVLWLEGTRVWGLSGASPGFRVYGVSESGLRALRACFWDVAVLRLAGLAASEPKGSARYHCPSSLGLRTVKTPYSPSMHLGCGTAEMNTTPSEFKGGSSF